MWLATPPPYTIERELEDHEQLVDVYSTWPRENNNVLLFRRNEKKYDLFEDPLVRMEGRGRRGGSGRRGGEEVGGGEGRKWEEGRGGSG